MATIHLGRPSLNGSSSQPGSLRANHSCLKTGARPLFGLAPGGVYHASDVTNAPVRFYRTLSPLPVAFCVNSVAHRRFALCGTFPKRPFCGRSAGVTRHPCFVEPGLSSRTQTDPRGCLSPLMGSSIEEGPTLAKPALPMSSFYLRGHHSASSGESRKLQISAPIAAPINGATQNSQS